MISMEILVKVLHDQEIITLKVEPFDTMENIKLIIWDRKGIPPEH